MVGHRGPEPTHFRGDPVTHSVGSIVKARDREWIVLPNSSDEVYNLQPLGGNQEEATTILTAVESVSPAAFPLPEERHLGDHRSARILRDAARLQNRNTTGPFRSFGRLGIDLRPYQMVPLLLALRREPTRLLIADDVGIGKTVEALMIARELLDRGDIQRFCVLCPPHLAEQWTKEIQDKFHLDAVAYLPETADRLRRPLAADESVFTHYPVVVASIDFVKMESRREHFFQNCPEFVIVDEAHTCSSGADGHMRQHVVERICTDKGRHIVFVTATPHTGNEDNFRTLLGMLEPELKRLPDNLQGEHNEKWRRKLADFMVQRRRENIRDYADERTPFPTRYEQEESYALSPEYRALVEQIIEAQRNRFQAASNDKIRSLTWWSLLSILRALASSPMAAAQTLRVRSGIEDASDVDEAGRRALIEDPQEPKENDATVGANTGDPQFLKWADEIEGLAGKDKKLSAVEKHIKALLEEGHNPIVFCQYIPTARHVAQYLENKFKDVGVTHVTGNHAPADRRARIDLVKESEKRVLVATDCLSEGINLQDGFSAVIHYDLAWTPTRHEQREGRVDRYGQASKEVKMLTLYGVDNVVDGIVLEVLHKKQASITGSTGVHVPVPDRAGDVLEAIMQSLLVRGKPIPRGKKLTFQTMLDVGEGVQSHIVDFEQEWRESAARAKGRSMYAWESIKPAEVMTELSATREALGDEDTVRRFVTETLERLGAGLHGHGDIIRVTTSHWEPELRRRLGIAEELKVCFSENEAGAVHLHRTHPIVEGLCDYVIETAIDDLEWGPASRCGVTRIEGEPTGIFLARFRYQLRQGERDSRTTNLVEEIRVLGYRGEELLPEAEVVDLFDAEPSSNLSDEAKGKVLRYALRDWSDLQGKLKAFSELRCAAILETHRRVQKGGRMTRRYTRLEPEGEPDLIGCYVFLQEVSV